MGQSIHRIVAIEDNDADATLLRHALDLQGEPYSLEILPDGESALKFVRDHCRADEPEPCLIILDLHLPRYDGATVLREIRKSLELAHVTVAVVTTIASPEEHRDVLKLGVNLYRTKPTTWAATVELARELLELCKNPQKTMTQPA